MVLRGGSQYPHTSNNHSNFTMELGKESNIAKLKGAVWEEWMGVVRAEERTNMLRSLILEGVGTDDVENFIGNQANIRHRGYQGVGVERDRVNVKGNMQSKLDDSILDADIRRQARARLRSRLEEILGKKSGYKRFINKVRDKAGGLRQALKKHHLQRIRDIRIKRKEEKRFELPQELRRYKSAKIFLDEHEGEFKPGDMLGPVIVGGNNYLLNKDEVAVLSRGPKFTIRRILSKERFLIELEKAFVKLRWELKDLEDELNETVVELSEEEQAEDDRVKEVAELLEAKARMMFDDDTLELDCRKQRCTDAKHNTRIILPGPLSPKLERELECRRMEWIAIYDAYVKEFCDEEGVQENNLTESEARGLKSLKKRVAEGSLIVCQTDKSSRFAIMSQEEYLAAGQKHVAKDEEVSLEFLLKNQSRLNGHVSMLLKTFNAGADWNHQARLRATKLTHSLSIAPLYLLYKDHKGWTVEAGGPPPTRPVASAGGGQDDHLSETISIVLEPVANKMEGGMETTSTPDFISKIVELNKRMETQENDEIDLEEVDRILDERTSLMVENDHVEVPSMTATSGNASSAVVHNNDAENIELLTSHAGDEARDMDETLPEGWIMEMDDNTEVGEDDGHNNKVNKTYKKSSNATKKNK